MLSRFFLRDDLSVLEYVADRVRAEESGSPFPDAHHGWREPLRHVLGRWFLGAGEAWARREVWARKVLSVLRAGSHLPTRRTLLRWLDLSRDAALGGWINLSGGGWGMWSQGGTLRIEVLPEIFAGIFGRVRISTYRGDGSLVWTSWARESSDRHLFRDLDRALVLGESLKGIPFWVDELDRPALRLREIEEGFLLFPPESEGLWIATLGQGISAQSSGGPETVPRILKAIHLLRTP